MGGVACNRRAVTTAVTGPPTDGGHAVSIRLQNVSAAEPPPAGAVQRGAAKRSSSMHLLWNIFSLGSHHSHPALYPVSDPCPNLALVLTGQGAFKVLPRGASCLRAQGREHSEFSHPPCLLFASRAQIMVNRPVNRPVNRICHPTSRATCQTRAAIKPAR